MSHKNQTKAPIIGISTTLLTIESGSFIGRERVSIVHDYIEATRLAGGVPILLPIIEEKDVIHQQMQLIDGLILSGGYDVSPHFYHEEPLKELEVVRPERDKYEIELLKNARAYSKPILGICRGLQLINVVLGGSLYQDIEAMKLSTLQHRQKAKPEEATHTVKIVPGTRLHQIMEDNVLFTNSFHHQAIKELAPGLIANSYSQDGLIEGIEGLNDFILGVQWHPELMISRHPNMLKLFQALVMAAKQRGKE